MLNDVDDSASRWTKDITMPDARKWKTMTENRA
jgi:hypothetical protein